jgi:hypothetical protein
MPAQLSNDDFTSFSWHDNHIYGIYFAIQNWDADLALDIDYIVEWICGVDGGAQFRVAPATLRFHNVTDLKLNIDWGDSGFRTALHEISIHQITRERIANQQICLDRPYYRWTIETNFPRPGSITFGADRFTQVLRAEPILQDEQKLSRESRAADSGQ